MHISLLLEMVEGAEPDRAAIGTIKAPITARELAARARRAAAALCRHGDKLVYIGLNGDALPVAVFASGLAGQSFVPLNYRLPTADLRRLLERTAPSVAIVDDDMLGRVEGVPGVHLIPKSQFDHVSKADAGEVPAEAVENDIAVLLFTSGTTGEPKAAVLRHRHLTSYVIQTVEFLSAQTDEAALVSVPPYHIAGISAVITGVYSGRRIVYLPSFTPEAWVGVAATEKITHAMVVPTMLDRLLDAITAKRETLPHLRSISYGGGRMPASTIERALKLLPNVNFVNAYGLTETSSTISVLGPDDHRAALASEYADVRRRLGSVGRPIPGIELEIRGPDGKALPSDKVGEVYVRGEQVAGEYLDRKAIDDDGWFATNDSGMLDADGFLYVEGRLDDVIVRGGENISPGEIEEVLRTHPKVADVAVFGLPDDRWGECVAAAVVCREPKPSIDELTAWVKDRLRSTKTPEKWQFREELPYNETGKLLRYQLKAELSAPLSGLAS